MRGSSYLRTLRTSTERSELNGCRTRNDLFDFSIAGPAAGMACGLLLFAYGLAVTVSKGDASSSSETLVNVPYQVFNGSLLLGNVVKSFISSGSAHPLCLASLRLAW